MSSSRGKELKGMVLMEGMSIPFTSASCLYAEGNPGTCTIQVPPLPEIRKIKPRTMVHVFVRDTSYPGSQKPWVLMFDGEIYAYGQNRGAQNQSFSLFAMDYSNYWDSAKQYYMNLRTSLGDSLNTTASARSEQDLARDNIPTTFTSFSARAFLTNVITEKLKEDNVDLIDALVEVLKQIEEVNPFFRYNNRRYRINDRIAFGSSNNLRELLDFTNKESLWDELAGGGPAGVLSVRQVVEKIMNIIFHDFVSVPCPSKIPYNGERGIGENGNSTIGNFVFKPDTFMLPPPNCNVVFPDRHQSSGFNRNFLHEVSRVKFRRALSAVENQDGIARAFNPNIYSPRGFDEFRNKDSLEEEVPYETEQFRAEVDVGNYNEEGPEDNQIDPLIREHNYLSREELLKGIISDMGHPIPGSQVFNFVVPKEDQRKFFQASSDYLFAKKRYASRSMQSQGPLNLSPIPGFSCMFLDGSAAEQHFIGHLHSVQHTISAEQGASTMYQASFVREVDEEDLWSGELSEPPIPPWYDEEIFGKRRAIISEDFELLSDINKEKFRGFKEVNGFEDTQMTNGDYYKKLLGRSGSGIGEGARAIVTDNFPNIYAATLDIMDRYKKAREKGESDEFINSFTRRDYVTLTENFKFLGAEIEEEEERILNFSGKADIIFKGSIFDGGFVDLDLDKDNSYDRNFKNIFRNKITELRRRPLERYRNRLLNERGFRG